MDVDQRLVFPDHREVAGRDAVQPRSGGNHEVRLFPGPFLEVVPVDLQMSDIGRVVVGYRILTSIGGRDGRAARFGEFGQRTLRALEGNQFTCDDDRSFRGVDPARGPGNGFGIGTQRYARRRLRNCRRARIAVGNVLRHHEHDRPRPPRHGEFERTGRLRRHIRRRFRFKHCLRNAREHHVIIDFLEGFEALGGRRHIADDQQHGHRVLPRDMQPDGGIGRARPPADEADRRLAGNPAVCRAGEGDAGLMPGRGQADGVRPPLQPGKDGKVAFARNGKCRFHAPCRQRFRERFSAVHQQCPSACWWLSGSSRRCRCTT